MPHPVPSRLLLFALVLGGLVLKLAWIGKNELAHDEPFTVYWAQRSLGELFAMLRTENNPPLYFLLIKAWLPIAGLEVGALRVPSAVFSAFTVWPLFLLTHRWSGNLAALVAALLFLFNNHLYGFAHEVRSYSLWVLLATTAMWQLARLSDGRKDARWILLLVNVLMVYTHFFGWLVIGLQMAFVLLIPAWRTMIRNHAISVLLVMVAYLPYVGLLVHRAATSIDRGTWLPPPAPEEIYNMIWRWSNAPVIAVALLLLIAYTTIRYRTRGTALQLGLLWTFIPLFAMFLVSFLVPIFLDRYLSFAAPGFFLLVGVCIASLPPYPARFATGALVLGLILTFTPWEGNGMYPSKVVAQIERWRMADPSAQVLVVPPWYRLTYRFAEDPRRSAREEPDELYDPLLEPGLPGTSTILLVHAAPPDTVGATLISDLRATHSAIDSAEIYRKVWVYHWKKNAVTYDPSRP